MKNRKRKGWIENIIGMLFILVLFLFMFINLAVPDREMSEKENRMLETRPVLSMSTVLDGEFMEQWENYQSDQFAGRDFWRSVKVFLDRLGGSRMENGVYIGKSGQLLEEIEVPDDGQSEANLSAIVDFAEKYPDVQTSVMLVPDAACILSDRLPAFAGVEDQKQLLGVAKQRLGDDVNWIDAVSVLNNHVSDKLYYKTDHHWTTLAAFYVFRESAASLGIDGEVGENFASYTISDDFNGVLASKSGVGLSEKETIDKVLGFDTLGKRYQPEISDPVKNEYNPHTTKEYLMEYFKVWFQGFLKHPEVYVEATLNNIYGYFYPGHTRWYIYSNYYSLIEDEGVVDYHYNSLQPLRDGLAAWGHAFPYIPGVGMISNIGFHGWLLLLFSVYSIIKKKREYLYVLLPFLVSLLICLASPVNSYFRYAMPYVFFMPFLVSIFVSELKLKKDK